MLVRNGRLVTGSLGEDTFDKFPSTVISNGSCSCTLKFHISSEDMLLEMGRPATIDALQRGEFSVDDKEYTLVFHCDELKNIAIAQLSLVKYDLMREFGKTFSDEDYLSAMDFVKTEGFVKTCIVAGMEEKDARERADYLSRRYSKHYVIELNKAMEQASSLDYSTVTSLEFAFELANELFENRNDPNLMLRTRISTSEYWRYLSSHGVKADVVKRHLVHLLQEMGFNFNKK